MRRIPAAATFLCATACSDYGVGNKPDEADPGTTTTTTTPSTTTTTPEPTTPAPTTPPADCADFDFTRWQWSGSIQLSDEADPVDGAGKPFYDPAFAPVGWSPVVTPDRSIAVGFDRAYLAKFELTALPPGMVLDLESDDGIWVWLNGTAVGHWGGDWQQEGCVNENAECVQTIAVPPVDVTSLLVVGTNTLAARVSNPVANSWFEILASCAE